MISIRARACIRCKEYVKIYPEKSENQDLIKSFEKEHYEHNLVTLDIDEIKDSYMNYESHLVEMHN